MKVTLNWLKEFVDINISVEELAEKLTNSGSEVEEIIYQNKYLHHVVVGRILEIKQHPNAEKLVICQVDIGDKHTQIITAAKNIKVNDLVPVSLPGATLVNGINITASKLRGEDSFGMFCSVEELGVTDYDGEHDGIMILEEGAKEGALIEDVLGMNDVILDINVTANRPDCMSVIGIAREISALLSSPFKEKNYQYKVDKSENISSYINIEVKNQQLCPRYMAKVIKDVKIQKSPAWLRQRLTAVGVNPINNIVDITNYVLIECGQPMHAFDYSNLSKNKIIVRNAQKGEIIKALNNNTYQLKESMLTICDGEKPVVIAGIIGGLNSCVTNSTNISVLESACFERASVRRTGKSIGVRTDSTARFEKGVDVGSPEVGLERALALISELNCATIIDGVIDIIKSKPKQRELTFSLDRIFKLLGIEIESTKVIDILNNLGITSTINNNQLQCTIPVYRNDIENDADIAEELIRMYGYDIYDNIDSPPLENSTYTVSNYDKILKEERKLKNKLCNFGFDECVNFSICSNNVSDKLLLDNNDKLREMIKISNPISEDISYVRTCMANSMFTTISRNLSRQNANFKLFEAGKVYIAKQLPLQQIPEEINYVSFASVCLNDDFFTFKGVIEKLLSDYDLTYTLNYSKKSFMHPGKSADIVDVKTNKVVGVFGIVHPKVCKNFEIAENTVYAEVNLTYLANLNQKEYSVKPLSKYPAVERDIAIVCDENTKAGDLLESIKKSCGALFYSVNLFDVYRNVSLGENKKSLAFNIKLLSYEKTLTDEEVNIVINKVVKDLCYKFGALQR